MPPRGSAEPRFSFSENGLEVPFPAFRVQALPVPALFLTATWWSHCARQTLVVGTSSLRAHSGPDIPALVKRLWFRGAIVVSEPSGAGPSEPHAQK